MKRRKKIVENPRKTFLIVTSSEAELLYFSQMRKDCRYTNMSLIWANEATNLDDLVKFAAKERTKGKFDTTWCFFSFESYQVTTQDIKDVQELAKKRKVQLAWTNPSLPLWYLLHLQSPRMPINDNKVIEDSLKSVFAGFSSDANYLLGDGSSLHLRLFPAKAQAVMNSGTYNTMAMQQGYTVAPINFTKLINEISDVCGVADMSHNQKMIGLKNA